MTEYTTPITTTFELQRTALKQGQRTIESGMEFQKRMNEAVLDGFDSQEAAQRRTIELTQSAMHSYLDAVEATVPGGASGVEEIRDTVDEQFATLDEGNAEAFDVVGDEFETGVEAYDQLATDYLSALEEQIDLVLEANEEVEGQTIDAIEQAQAQFERAEEQFEQAQARFEEQTEQFQEQFDRQFEQFQEQVEELQTQMEEIQQRTQDRVEA